jgi:hypothetical protein
MKMMKARKVCIVDFWQMHELIFVNKKLREGTITKAQIPTCPMNAGMEADRMSLMDEHINTLEYSDK